MEIQRLSPVLMECQIEVPAAEVTSEINTTYDRLKRTARVKGFRKGKAPRSVIAQVYGPSVRADVAQRLMDSRLQAALSERQIQPLTKPAVEPAELKPKQPFSFRARFEVRPEIEKVDWEGLKATRRKVEIKAEEVDAEIEKLRLQHSTLEPVEKRGAKEGDVVTVALGFSVDGQDQNEQIDVEVGKNQILPEIEKGLEGLKAGEKKEVAGKFPDNHPQESLRGADVTFQLDVKEVKERILPKIDDEFAKDCDQDDLKALKAHLSEQLSTKETQRVEEELARQLVAELCSRNPVPVPPSLVQQQAQITQRELQMLAQMGGQLPQGVDLQQHMQTDAETKVRAGLLMAEIAKAKEVKVTDDDLEEGYKELAGQTGKNVAKVKAEYRERSKREMLIGMILEDKVLDLMEAAAKIEEV